jgi:hypothetical protein
MPLASDTLQFVAPTIWARPKFRIMLAWIPATIAQNKHVPLVALTLFLYGLLRP